MFGAVWKGGLKILDVWVLRGRGVKSGNKTKGLIS